MMAWLALVLAADGGVVSVDWQRIDRLAAHALAAELCPDDHTWNRRALRARDALAAAERATRGASLGAKADRVRVLLRTADFEREVAARFRRAERCCNDCYHASALDLDERAEGIVDLARQIAKSTPQVCDRLPPAARELLACPPSLPHE